MDEKVELIEEIKALIDANSETSTNINMKYIEFFELDELISIRDDLENKKNNPHQETNDFLDEIFSKCS